MSRLVNVMNELKALKGSKVEQFGDMVDTLDILNALSDFEMEEIEFLNIDEEDDSEEWGMVSIDDMSFDYKIYENKSGVIIEFKANREYSAVKCNYTESVFLKFDRVSDFLIFLKGSAIKNSSWASE